MARLILSRMIQLPIILAVILLVTFFLVWIIPGSPVDRNPDRPLSPETIKMLEKKYNINNPGMFLYNYAKNAMQGDFGPSLQRADTSVNEIITEKMPISVTIGLSALIVALIVGLLAGIVGALKPGSFLDMSSLGVAVIGISLPSFVTASILLLLFAGVLQWFPISGWGTPQHLILPAIALGLGPAAYIARLVRLGLADVMNSDFIRTARAKGLSPKDALFNHAMKVAFLPVLSFLGPAAATTMTGSFVVETVFAIPGLGGPFVDAVQNKDQFLILGLVMVYSTMLIVFNLIVDLAYAWIDPRIDLA
jgi:oligopeptide transport system permease protein